MTTQQIAETLATLNQAMTTTRPTVSTSGCTNPNCTCGGAR